MPRVGFYSPGWPLSSYPNGIVSYVAYLRAALENLGYESVVLAAATTGVLEDPTVFALDHADQTLGTKLVGKLLYRVAPDRARNLLAAQEIAATFRRMERSGRVDLFEIEESFGTPLHLGRMLGVPMVVRLHGPWFLNGPALGVPEDDDYRRRVDAERRAIAAATAITSPSRDVLDAVRERHGLSLPDAEVIPNPGPLLGRERCWSADACEPDTIVFIGRFDAHKGGDLMLDAFAKVAAERPSARLLFAGPDRGVRTASGVIDLPSYLTKHVQNAEVRARITYLGPQSGEQVAALRRRGAVTAVASRYENFPMTVVEALAFGTPLVLAEAGGMREMVRDGISGLFFKSGDAADLARKLSEVLRDPATARRLAAGARAEYEERFTPAVVARAMRDYYDRVLARHRGASP